MAKYEMIRRIKVATESDIILLFYDKTSFFKSDILSANVFGRLKGSEVQRGSGVMATKNARSIRVPQRDSPLDRFIEPN
jgi:hypothetical protein